MLPVDFKSLKKPRPRVIKVNTDIHHLLETNNLSSGLSIPTNNIDNINTWGNPLKIQFLILLIRSSISELLSRIMAEQKQKVLKNTKWRFQIKQFNDFAILLSPRLVLVVFPWRCMALGVWKVKLSNVNSQFGSICFKNSRKGRITYSKDFNPLSKFYTQELPNLAVLMHSAPTRKCW